MKKRGIIWLIAVCVMVLFCGCGKISNDKIIIKKYKGLEIEVDKETPKDELAKANREKKVWDAVLPNCEVKEYPKDSMEEYTEDVINQCVSYANLYEITPEEAVEKVYGIPLERVVKKEICKDFAVELIAEKEGLTITDEEYQEGLKELASQYDFEDPEEFEKFAGKEKVKLALLKQKVTEFLVEHN